MPRTRAYLSICSIYRDEAPYLREWIEFHRLVGVERFYLYDNFSSDDHHEALAPYVEDGIVVHSDWPHPFKHEIYMGSIGEARAFSDCLSKHGDESRWFAAMLDIDDFLFSPTWRPVSEVLREYEEWPGVHVGRVGFGTSGHKTKPPGLVIENYVHCDPGTLRRKSAVKPIVDPARVAECTDAHNCDYTEGDAVDETKRLLPPRTRILEPPSFEKLRINHYAIKSEEEYLRKVRTWQAAGIERPKRTDFPAWHEKHREIDEGLLRYVPAVRDALARAATRDGAVRDQAEPSDDAEARGELSSSNT